MTETRKINDPYIKWTNISSETSLKTIILNRVEQNSFRTYLSFGVNESLVSL